MGEKKSQKTRGNCGFGTS